MRERQPSPRGAGWTVHLGHAPRTAPRIFEAPPGQGCPPILLMRSWRRFSQGHAAEETFTWRVRLLHSLNCGCKWHKSPHPALSFRPGGPQRREPGHPLSPALQALWGCSPASSVRFLVLHRPDLAGRGVGRAPWQLGRWALASRKPCPRLLPSSSGQPTPGCCRLQR